MSIIHQSCVRAACIYYIPSGNERLEPASRLRVCSVSSSSDSELNRTGKSDLVQELVILY